MNISSNIPPYHCWDRRGCVEDFNFMYKDEWLMDTEVKYLIARHKGMYRLTMVYIHIVQPLRVIIRIIDSYTSIKKAEIYASIFQRGIRKDARGTLKANYNDFNICHN